MQPTLDTLVDRLLARAATPGRPVILGIAGAPGSGKSTLAEQIVGRLRTALPGGGGGAGAVAYAPMDGFHLADVSLRRLGSLDRKGAPDTFDPDGYVALLERVRQGGHDVWAPAFDREIEQPIAGSIRVPAGVRYLVTEGNYLLLDSGPWKAVRPLLDEAWYCRVPEPVRLDRLTERHIRFGKQPQAAYDWARGTDQRNAELIEPSSIHADLIVELD